MQPTPVDPTQHNPMTRQPLPRPQTPMPSAPSDPQAPYGRDPLTGHPLSDKQKLAAGLLQIFLGQWGVGRFYLGDPKQGLIHLGLFFGGFFVMLLGIAFIPFLILGLLMVFGNVAWALIDGLMILTDKVSDTHGRRLR
jgi:TM2 domain-containing membrane protein YozV